MVPCAYLRVFEPLDAFPAEERERWDQYVAGGHGLTVSAAARAEHRSSMTRFVTGRTPRVAGSALVRRVNGRTHICPLQLAERHAVALLAFRDSVPEPAIDAFITRDESRQAQRAVETLYRPPHIQAASWEVPLRWFAAFLASERHFVDPPEGGGPRLTYLTTARAALERLDRATSIVEASLDEAEAIVDQLTELVDWLASFDDDSVLELDYGGLTAIIPVADLATDGSCEEIWQILDALETGDVSAALHGYETVTGRWELLRQRCRTN